MTWLMLAFDLWLKLFYPSTTSLLFSRRDDEAVYLLKRQQGIEKRLPAWMRTRRVLVSNDHAWHFSNGSETYAFPTTAGDSYTASTALVDEADLIPDLDKLMTAVKPTIDGGGRMILLSRSNKDEPNSPFKTMYKAAKAGKSPWVSVFLPWWSRPDRGQVWYADQKSDILARTTALDDLYEQYPATDAEALMARTMDKRLPTPWLVSCYQEMTPLESVPDAPAVAGLQIFRPPESNMGYYIGADPAEGNPTSDDSSVTVMSDLGEEVASLAERQEPSVMAENIVTLSRYYNGAGALIERNNHGHAVLLYLSELYPDVNLLPGIDGNAGWLSTTKSKAIMWSTMADAAKDKTCVIHSEKSFLQLQCIEGASLKAPSGDYDDAAVSYALAVRAKSGEDAYSVAYAYQQSRV
jgi:hypothetical protein